MPLVLQDGLPAIQTLREENVFVMEESKAISQDIRPLRIAILNLMPLKINTEKQILRQLSNSPLQLEIELLRTRSHQSKNTPIEHLERFYKTFADIKKRKYDGFIITGAPVEHLPFEEVDYWEELTEILDWTRKNVTSTLFICWGSQAGLYHFYGVPKHNLSEKMFGLFYHNVLDRNAPIIRGFDDWFLAPHSRHTETRREDLEKIPQLDILSESKQAGVYLAATRDGKEVYVTGHSEYDPLTLKEEYERDIQKGMPINVPSNYFPNNDPSKEPEINWRSHAHLLFSNWLNYYVYQMTPFYLDDVVE